MRLKFVDQVTADHFVLGSVSFGFLDRNNVFDEFQEDSNQYSEVIFQTSSEKAKLLADKITTLVQTNSTIPIRQDICEKLIQFIDFLSTANDIKAFVD